MNNIPEMTDLVFGLRGEFVPENYAFALWRELARRLPWLEADEFAGILPLRVAASGGNMLLPQRAKLVLRLAADCVQQGRSLSGQELDVGGSVLRVGDAVERPLKPHPTLHAQMVESSCDEEVFTAGVTEQLHEMAIDCKLICGKRLTVAGARQMISGYSLVLHDLKPDASLRIQNAGLGGNRRFGCGIFVPHKAISGL